MASIRWTKHLPDYKDQQGFHRKLDSSEPVLEVLRSLIKEDYAVSERIVHDRELMFVTPAWAEKTAFELGYQKALKDILTLIKAD